ncbi:uncharacterized protein LOC110837128 isoform X2 [Zootermopsis nevadensis]|uniref:uncharacterized protein LOC110837128 isoform X2 n=1 Tax=Zootermopsis nevadensis TaxID=136037 RepID=UPI000B8E56EB|nr:uncharacterized protein LOC110837128 isoform X2 [Zootermopsis nevadensis]
MSRYFRILLTSLALLTVNNSNCQCSENSDQTILSRKLRYVFFPEGSTMGTSGDVSEAWFAEADYHVPEISSTLPPLFDDERSSRISRDLNRTGVYTMLEKTFHRFGFNGRECLLRTICEVSAYELHRNKHNGLFGDLFHIVFTLTTMVILAVQPGNYLLEQKTELPIMTRKVRHIIFPEGTTMGLFLSATIPLENKEDVYVGWFFEANYHVPEYPQYLFSENENSRTSRGMDRRRTYAVLENLFQKFGFQGRECLLNTICEAANTQLFQSSENGLLGDILHILFTPSSSLDEKLSPAFNIAEEHGRNGEDCRLAYPKCSIGILDVITRLED